VTVFSGKVYVAGQKRGLSAAIKRAFRRRSAVEPVIGHLKNEIAWVATISPEAAVTPQTPSSPPQVTTSGSCSSGSAFCVPGSAQPFALFDAPSGFHRDFQIVSLRFSRRLIGDSSDRASRRNDRGQIRKTLFRRIIYGEGNFPHFDTPLLSAKHTTAYGRSATARQSGLFSN
jgi:hypothetical protein